MKKGFCAHKKKFTGIIAVLLYRLTRGRIGGRHLLREETAALGGLYYINGPDVLPQPLSAAEETDALEALAAGSEAARTRLIEHNLRLVAFIARRYENSGVGIEDLISIGTPGLIKAVGTFRADRNIKLATYASRCIENEILMHLRKISGRQEVSIDEPLNTDWDGNELLLSDILGNDEPPIGQELEEDEERRALYRAVSHLGERERLIIELRFGLGGRREETQKEVADRLGISQSYISRLEKKILAKLRTELESV
ncbi:MAG: sigma-70 family RNA polymerase sigma factor [Clostridia bacterium]|nr:sigma-70 family RNA polymerase sigma factor [Clostridia bacterium]